MIYGGLFDLDNKLKRKDELENIINSPEFWNSEEREKMLKENNYLNELINNVVSSKNKIDSNISILDDCCDDEMLSLIALEYDELKVLVDKLRIDTYLSGEFDKNDCILERHSGAGGTESCDFAMMLYRMYTRYLVKNGYKYEEIDRQPGEEVGVKSILINVIGNNAYGYFKGERGVHRLVRISPFDANKRRHTSFASVEVTPKFDNVIDININDGDLRVDIYRSSGPGGQGVNTTDSAIRIRHIPTGIVVQCQNERSQIQNKESAMKVLRAKLAQLAEEQFQADMKQVQGSLKKIEWGSQIRSYVFCPYTMVKDHRTGAETSNVEKVMDGDLKQFSDAFLLQNTEENQ